MSKAKNLRQKALELSQEADAIFKRWETKEETPSEELVAMSDLMAKADKLHDEADTIEKLEVLKARSTPKNEPKEPVSNIPQLTETNEVKSASESANKEMTKHDAFIEYMQKGQQRASTKALNRVEADSGGVFVPEEFRNELITRMRDINKLRSLVTVMPIGSASVKLPVFNHDASLPFVVENGAISYEDFDDSFGEQRFTPNSKKRLIKISNELLRDAEIAIDKHLLDHMSVRMAEVEEDDIMNGDGVNEAQGLLNATSNYTAETLTAANWTTAADVDVVLDAFESARAQFPQQYRANASILVSRDTMSKLRKLRDLDLRPLIQFDAKLGDFPTLMGMRIVEVEAMPAAATTGDAWAILADLKKYVLVERQSGLRVDSDSSVLFENDQMAYRVIFEQDGAMTDSRAITRINFTT